MINTVSIISGRLRLAALTECGLFIG